jgi:hypothetical protein
MNSIYTGLDVSDFIIHFKNGQSANINFVKKEMVSVDCEGKVIVMLELPVVTQHLVDNKFEEIESVKRKCYVVDNSGVKSELEFVYENIAITKLVEIFKVEYCGQYNLIMKTKGE